MISTTQLGLRREAGLLAHSRALEAVQKAYIPPLGYSSSKAAASDCSFLLCFSKYELIQLREKKESGEREGDNETVMGVSAQTKMCGHCQPQVTEKNKPSPEFLLLVASVSVA